jgi:hypothetical protein
MIQHPFSLTSFAFARINDIPSNPHTYAMLSLVPVWFFVWFTQKSTFKAYLFFALTVYIPESFFLIFFFMHYGNTLGMNGMALRTIGYILIVSVLVVIAHWKYRAFNKWSFILCSIMFLIYLAWYLVGFPTSLSFENPTWVTPLFNDFRTNLIEVSTGWVIACMFILWAYTTRNVH